MAWELEEYGETQESVTVRGAYLDENGETLPSLLPVEAAVTWFQPEPAPAAPQEDGVQEPAPPPAPSDSAEAPPPEEEKSPAPLPVAVQGSIAVAGIAVCVLIGYAVTRGRKK